MRNKIQYLIPKPPFTDLEMYKITRFTTWIFSETASRDTDNNIPFELMWKTKDEETTIHYIEDELVQFSYIVVKGKDVDKVVSKICSKIEVYSNEEIFRKFIDATNRSEKMKAVAYLGVASPYKFDAQFFELLQTAFSDVDSEVRRTAVWCIGYASWPEFKETLDRLAKSDPDELVREHAGYLAAAYEQHGIN